MEFSLTITIWIKGPQLTSRDYLNDSNNAGHQHSIKNLDCRIGRFHQSDLGGTTNQMVRFRIFHIFRVCQLRVFNPYKSNRHTIRRAQSIENLFFKNYFALMEISRNIAFEFRNSDILFSTKVTLYSKYLIKYLRTHANL